MGYWLAPATVACIWALHCQCWPRTTGRTFLASVTPTLQDLAARTNTTGFLSVAERDEAVAVLSVDPPTHAPVRIGYRLVPDATAFSSQRAFRGRCDSSNQANRWTRAPDPTSSPPPGPVCASTSTPSARPVWGTRRVIAQMLMSSVLVGLPHSARSFLEATAADCGPAYVARAIEYLEANLSEPLSVQNVARAVGVSVRQLHTAFRTYRGTTPTLQLRELRLACAHRMLADACPDETVSGIALACGFSHFGRFES
jgi:AraC-like DNA-binding protein